MIFRKLTIDDKHIIDKRLASFDYLGSDFCYGSWFSFYNFSDMQISVTPDSIYIMAEMDGEKVFLPPISEDFKGAVKKLKDYADKSNIKFKIVFALASQVKELADYTITGNRDNFEYIYNSDDLISLPGKKYHGKRNHIAKFESTYEYRFVPYEDDYYNAVLKLLNFWAEEKGGIDDEEEKHALELMLKYRKELNFFADVIFVGEVLAGVAIGDITSSGTGVVLFEKADYNYDGIYTALNQLFAKKHFSKVKYINRQEDMGLEGLRTSKKSYHPVKLLEKFTITASKDEQLKNLYKKSFNDSDKYINHFFKEKAGNSETFFIEKDGEIQSALYCFDRGLILEGNYINARFITAAATLPQYRGNKIMAEVIKNTLKKLYADGVALIILEPYKQNYYTRHGFATITNINKVVAEFNTKRPYIEKVSKKAAEFKTAYDNFCKNYNFFINRTECDFKNRLKEISAVKGESVVIYDEKTPIGYYLSVDGNIEECVLSKTDLKKVSSLNGKQVIIPDGKEFMMPGGIVGSAQARIINLYRFVECLPLPEGFDVNIKINDDMFCANSGIFKFTCINGQKRMEVADTYEIELSIAEFTHHAICGADSGRMKDIFLKRKGFVVDRY